MRTLFVRLLRPIQAVRPEGPCLVAWALFLVALQGLGRSVRSDWVDLVALGLFGLAVFATYQIHQHVFMGWVQWVERRLVNLWTRLMRSRPQLGLDFRRTPPVPWGIPRPYLLGPVLAAALVAAVLFGGDRWLGSLRFWSTTSAYLPYLLLVGLLWTLALALGLRGLSSVFLQLREWFLLRRQDGKAVGADVEVRAYMFLGADLLLCMVFLPIEWGLGLLALAGAACFVIWLWPQPEALILLWRNPRGEMRRFSMRTYYLLYGGSPYAMAWALVWVLRGGLLEEPARLASADSMLLSEMLAIPCAWGCAVAYGAIAIRQVANLRWQMHFHPARRHRPIVHIAGLLSEGEQTRLRRSLARQRLGVAFDGKAAPEHITVQLALESDPAVQDAQLEPRWPLPMTLDQLVRGDRRVVLMRRWQQQCRRILLRGLRGLFKTAAAREFLRGEGFWVGIQHVLVRGLIRDQGEVGEHKDPLLVEESIIGKPYHLLFPAVVRHYFHGVARDLQFDLIYVADGVRFAGLRSVFQTLFEVHDVYGGSESIQERHFATLHNVRVLIQDVERSGSVLPKSYREPDYTEVGRARILLICPNHGGNQAPVHVPTSGGRVPVLY